MYLAAKWQTSCFLNQQVTGIVCSIAWGSRSKQGTCQPSPVSRGCPFSCSWSCAGTSFTNMWMLAYLLFSLRTSRNAVNVFWLVTTYCSLLVVQYIDCAFSCAYTENSLRLWLLIMSSWWFSHHAKCASCWHCDYAKSSCNGDKILVRGVQLVTYGMCKELRLLCTMLMQCIVVMWVQKLCNRCLGCRNKGWCEVVCSDLSNSNAHGCWYIDCHDNTLYKEVRQGCTYLPLGEDL